MVMAGDAYETNPVLWYSVREMARYNIYKVKDGQVGDLQAHLTDERHYTQTAVFDSGGYHIYVYFSDAPPTEIWWLEQYADYLGGVDKRNLIYSAAVIAKKDDDSSAYVIPLGKTHFYISDYVELSFGLELAESIADNSQAKMKSLKSFGGRTSKSLVSYNSESSLIFSSCESAEYIKLKARDKDKWGKSFIHFGTSVQINSSEVVPSDLGSLIGDIETALHHDGKHFRLPLMKEVDIAQAGHLFEKLADKMLGQDQTIHFLDYEIYGVDFVFTQQTHVRLKYQRQYSDNLPELHLENILEFAARHEIDLAQSVSQIRVQVLVDGDAKYTVPLIRLMEYHDDDSKCFLFRGKWFHFNQSFLDTLHTALANVVVERFPMDFVEAEFKAWEAERQERVHYRERFVLTKISDQLGYEIFDRSMDYQHAGDKSYAIEVGDLYDDVNQKIVVAKIGSPRDFSYAFDQAYAVLSNVVGGEYIVNGGQNIPIKEVEVLLIFKTDRVLNSATDTQSLIFEIKLNELNRIAQERNVQLKLSCSTIL